MELTGAPTAAEAIGYAVRRRADLVAVVDVDDVGGALVEEGTWIRTRPAGTGAGHPHVFDAPAVLAQQRVEMNITGGEVRIGKVLVKAGVLQLPAHRQYLLFMQDRGAPLGMSNTYTPLLIENGRLGSTWRPETPSTRPDPLNGLTLSEVAKQVSRVRQ